MHLALKSHPGTACSALARIEVDVARSRAGTLSLRYRATGTMDDLLMPPLAAPERADGLWQHTCFEAFLRAPSDAAYHEFNFAPSTRWAAYRLSGYRSGMIDADLSPPRIGIRSGRDWFELDAELDLGSPGGLPLDAPWHVGLSAVIEETSGRKSYWALAHPPGKPDFHHEDCFALQLAPAA
jgi:hypothetical protein